MVVVFKTKQKTKTLYVNIRPTDTFREQADRPKDEDKTL